MRQLYVKHDTSIPIQQGVIISGCVADNYKCNVFGLIITPRCDIDHEGKVSTIHYLPIVPFQEWLKTECIPQCIQAAVLKKKQYLQQLLKEKGISPTILDGLLDKETILRIISSNKNIVNEYNTLLEMANESNIHKKVKENIVNQINELKACTHKRSYLIENWDNPNDLNVILLRQVKRIQYSLAKKYKRGFQERIISEDVFNNNDIASSKDNIIYKSIAEISSPYIEHIIQSFSYNFCRIGIQEMDDSIKNSINY